MRTSEEIDKIAVALVKFQGEVESPKKSVENDAFKKGGKALKYADLDAIIKTVTPALANHGLSQHQFTETDLENKAVKITTMLLHESGQFIFGDTLILPAESFGKFNAQTVGSAITYGRRYSLSAILGIASENDDDANSISGQDNQSNQKQQDKPQEAPPKPATTEQKSRLKNKIHEYVAIRGMDDEEGLNKMIEWFCKKVKAKTIETMTYSQAFAATEAIDKMIVSELQKDDAPEQQAEQSQMDFTYPQAEK